MEQLEDTASLRSVYRSPTARVIAKQLDRLDRHCRRFIELSPFVIIATANGGCDASPRGGPPGFVKALDESHLAFGDSPGNNRLDSLSNLLANPEIGLLFLVPGFNETLRVNGTATITRDDALREALSIEGKLPASVMTVSVREAYLHCGKSIMRSKLWEPEARVARDALPSLSAMIKEQTGSPDPVLTQAEMEAQFKKVLY